MRELIVLLAVAAMGCGGEKPSGGAAAAERPASAAAAAAPAAAPAKARHRAPGTLPDHFDDAVAKAALAWLDQADPVAVDEVPGLRVPAGAVRSATTLGDVTILTYIYDKTPREEGAYAYVTLLDEDGWKITEWKRVSSGAVMFAAAHDNREFKMLAGAPTGKEATSSTLGVVVPKVPVLGRPIAPIPVRALWDRDKKGSPAMLLRTYGKLGYVRYKDAEGSVGWALLAKLEPPQPIGPEPIEKCGVAAGDRVRSEFSLRHDRTWPGKIVETHGGVAFVKFDDGSQHWVECNRIRKK